MLYTKFQGHRTSGSGEDLVWIGQAVLRRCLKLRTTDGRRRTDDGLTPEHGYTIRSFMSLWLR